MLLTSVALKTAGSLFFSWSQAGIEAKFIHFRLEVKRFVRDPFAFIFMDKHPSDQKRWAANSL